MKFLKTGLSVALAVTGLALVPGSPSAAVGAARTDDPTGVSALRAAADGTVVASTDSATGKVGFVAARGANADLLPGRQASSPTSAVAKATAYLDQYGSSFGLGKDQLVQGSVTPSQVGWTVTYHQEYRGLPVFGSALKATVDEQGDLTSVAGYAAPDLDLSTTPRLSPSQAAERAVGFVKEDPPTSHEGAKADTSGVEAVTNELQVYRLGALKGEQGEAVLAYVVEVSDGGDVRDQVFIDANTGKPVNRYSLVHAALDRELNEATGTAAAPVITKVWGEGDPFPGSLNVDQQNLVNSAGESYWMFKNTFGRDSYDGEGARMRTVNNDPRISCPNANWNGTTTNYCNGVTSDDVVSHEWGHAYTEYTSGLIYQYQSGALNEAYSDVWGETLDLINNREDEGEENKVRTTTQCDPTAPAKLQVNITAPASAAGPCTAAAAGFGPAFTAETITAEVVVATDAADAAGPSTTDGCSAYSNATAVSGKWAYADRGTCSFQIKADQAKAAGAVGIVFGNNAAGLPISPSGESTIRGLMVTQGDGARIKGAGAVAMTIQAEDASTRPVANRWLVGEKSTAFGGAIRDMWNPTCYGNPGKVSDAEYNCDPLLTDNGGVHGNSGVPNHAYALMVDGGTYNGQTIAGIGLDKAANIWWVAQTAHLVPSSDFTDAANALEQSCAELVGRPINKLSTVANATPAAADSITATDCQSVSKAVVAVEMRKDPVQCNFQPLLAPGKVSPCGDGTVVETTVVDDFEKGLTSWTPEQQLATGATEGFPWKATDQAPGGRTGTVAYAPDPDEGACAPGDDDISSRDSIVSKELTVPAGQTPRVSVDHYVATEGGYDGGNVKASVNGSPFLLVPASAYLFNPYNATMAGAATNTSPLAGQPGFTGTDGGKTVGSWGQSTISLAKLGVKAGDKVKLRFDFGRDGCGGNDGWYLDNLVLTVCKDATDLTAVHQPQPSTFGNASSVKVSAPEEATGTVTLEGAGAPVTAELDGGTATLPLPADTPAGTYALTVSYAGDGTFGAAEVPVAVTVRKASTSVRVIKASKKVKRTNRVNVRVEVESPAGVPAGRVSLRAQGKSWGAATLRNGFARITTRDLNRVGTYKFTAVYEGGANYRTKRSRVITVRVLR
ncbi:M4 family metallopeptidase [Nocardioides litoris]|uniref:M4 family metallopeptidase n=1 Tax=Nocardioides litoris TaxID=1926648 RepID=UPI0014777F3D|nr:M4 family metallopeptidase [Nocardioides litoris]